MPKKENLQKRAETLFSPTKRALPSFNLFGATTRTPNRQVLTEVPRDSDFSPFTSSAPQDLLPKDFLKLLGGDFSGQLFKKMLIFDCRYEYEFEGGHFRSKFAPHDSLLANCLQNKKRVTDRILIPEL
jgi:hypothetical protein